MKIFKRHFKEAKDDALLPKSRKELFKTMLRDDFGLLADVSIMQGLFTIPLYILFSFVILILTGLSEKTPENITPLLFVSSLISIPLFMIRYIGRIGLFNVIKDRALNNSGFFLESFTNSLKENWARGIFIGGLVGIGYFIGVVGSTLFLLKAPFWLAKGLGIGISILIFIVFYVSGEYFCSINNYYELGLFGSLKNSISFMIMDLFFSLFYCLLSIAIPFALTLLSNFVYFIFIFGFSLYLDGLFMTLITLRSHFLFDISINKEYYQDQVNKGLYVKKED